MEQTFEKLKRSLTLGHKSKAAKADANNADSLSVPNSVNKKHSFCAPSPSTTQLDIHPQTDDKDKLNTSTDESPTNDDTKPAPTEPTKPRSIKPHPYTDDPNIAWEMLKPRRTVKPVRPMKLDTAVRPDAVRFVCIGCTHGLQDEAFADSLPPGDVLIVAGDFTNCGLPDEIRAFDTFAECLPYSHILVVGGNHELSLDVNFIRDNKGDEPSKDSGIRHAINASLSALRLASARDLLKHCTYLEDTGTHVFGISVHGSPWIPRYDKWAFNLERGKHLLEKWNQIETGTDVLITHTPPLGHGDTAARGRVGCVELLNSVVKRIRPKYHVFSHIHEGYGCTTDGYTKFINCSMSDEKLKMVHAPIIFDITIGEDKKTEYTNTNATKP